MTPTNEQQLRHAMGNMPTAQANRLRDLVMTPEQKKERKEIIAKFQMLKIAAMIACVISGALFAMMPTLFVGCVVALVGYCTYEVLTVSSNVKKAFKDFTVEARSGRDQQALLEQISKDTCLARYVIPLLW